MRCVCMHPRHSLRGKGEKTTKGCGATAAEVCRRGGGCAAIYVMRASERTCAIRSTVRYVLTKAETGLMLVLRFKIKQKAWLYACMPEKRLCDTVLLERKKHKEKLTIRSPIPIHSAEPTTDPRRFVKTTTNSHKLCPGVGMQHWQVLTLRMYR